MAKNPSETPPQEDARRLYEEEIAALKKSLQETRERMHLDQIKNEMKRKGVYEKSVKPIEEEIAAKEAEMRQALSGRTLEAKEGEAAEIAKQRARDLERRARDRGKKEQERKKREEKKKASVEEFRTRVSSREPPVSSEQGKGEEEEGVGEREEEKKPWEIEAIEGAQEDLEKEKVERKKETEKLVDEARIRKYAQGLSGAGVEKALTDEQMRVYARGLGGIGMGDEEEPIREPQKDTPEEAQRKEIERRVEAAYKEFDDAHGDTARLKALKEGVERSLIKYRQAVQRGEPALPEEELRLVKFQHAIEKALMQQEKKQEKELGKKEQSPPSPEEVQAALDVAINNIKAYYNNAGDDKTKIENALNAIESVLGDIRRAVQNKQWDAPEQKKHLFQLHHAMREKLKHL